MATTDVQRPDIRLSLLFIGFLRRYQSVVVPGRGSKTWMADYDAAVRGLGIDPAIEPDESHRFQCMLYNTDGTRALPRTTQPRAEKCELPPMIGFMTNTLCWALTNPDEGPILTALGEAKKLADQAPGLARVALRDVRSDPLDHRQKPGKDLQPEIIKFKSSVFSSPPDSVMGRCMLHVPAFVSDNFLHVQDGLYIRNFPQHIQSQLLEIERTVDGTEADRLALLYMVGLLLFQDCVQQGMTGMEEQLVDVMYDGLSVQGTAMRIAMDYAADSPDDILDDIPDDIPDDSPDDISGMLDMLNDVNSLDVSGQLTYTMQLDAHTRQLYYEALKHDVFSMARKRGTATESQKNWFVQVVHRAHQDIEICESKVSDFNTYVRRCMVEDGFAEAEHEALKNTAQAV